MDCSNPRPLGFSTGSLAKGEFAVALQMMADHPLQAVELSALRDEELRPLLLALADLNLMRYSHVSVHLPSRLSSLTEQDLQSLLAPVHAKGWLMVVHPDVIQNDALWQTFGDRLCLENMDKRKPIGRSADELDHLFQRFPAASLCLDLGHSKQIDSTMSETRQILRRHGPRLREIHLSDVNSASRHEPLNRMAITAFRQIAHLIPDHIPVILESPVERHEIGLEIEMAGRALPLAKSLMMVQ